MVVSPTFFVPSRIHMLRAAEEVGKYACEGGRGGCIVVWGR